MFFVHALHPGFRQWLKPIVRLLNFGMETMQRADPQARRKALGVICVATVLGIAAILAFEHGRDDFQSWLENNIDFLLEHNETRGYTNYWVSYRLAYLSDETIIFSPRLPYKADFSYTASDNRYPVYDEIVADSSRVAYITSKHPQLEQYIRQELNSLRVSFHEFQVGEFHIFYNLSEAIRPGDIGLEETSL